MPLSFLILATLFLGALGQAVSDSDCLLQTHPQAEGHLNQDSATTPAGKAQEGRRVEEVVRKMMEPPVKPTSMAQAADAPECLSDGQFLTFTKSSTGEFQLGDFPVNVVGGSSGNCNTKTLNNDGSITLGCLGGPFLFTIWSFEFTGDLPDIASISMSVSPDASNVAASYAALAGGQLVGLQKFPSGGDVELPLNTFDAEGFTLRFLAVLSGSRVTGATVKGVTLCNTHSNVVGDPHIRTLGGQHYTMLSQGTFALWRYSDAKESPEHPPVDFQVYAQYTGYASYTKGLLLVDKSGGSMRQSLEITSKDCQWKSKKPDQSAWSTVARGSQIIFVPAGDSFATGFNVTTNKQQNRVSIMVNRGGLKEIALLRVSCRAGHNIDLGIAMKHASDLRFVDGELRVARKHAPKSLSMLQVDGDEEFAVKTPWQDLGGSDVAALYFKELGVGSMTSMRASSFLLSCDKASTAEATRICSKHLGMEHATGAAGDFFKDCVVDVCRGGEVAAELAAELIADGFEV